MPFVYRDNHLYTGDHDLLELARSTAGPFYVYALGDILARARRMKAVFDTLPVAIHYAMKANGNHEILSRLAKEGLGADTVSGGEIKAATEAGFSPETIIFSGVGKTVHEIELAIHLGIKQINVESPQELDRIGRIAERLDREIDVAFRMNPDVSPQTHPYITTGFRENKFGMDETFLPELKKILSAHRRRLRLRGLTLHIGSQLLEIGSLEAAITKTVPVFMSLRSEGHPLDRFDIGGGLGINYGSDDTVAEFNLLADYGALAKRHLGPLSCEVLCEPGRILVARAGLLVGQVQYIKPTPHKTFAILDTGMHHLLRPALYQAQHRILPLEKRPEAPVHAYDIVGPICESADFLAKNVVLRELRPEDYVGIADAGAYGFSMASFYNRHEMPVEIVLE